MLLKNLYESDNPDTSKVYISINLPSDVSHKFPTIDDVKPHITVLYLQEQSHEDYLKIVDLVRHSVNIEPFTIDFGGLGKFDKKELVTFTKVKLCNGLKELRSNIESTLKQAGIEWENTYGDYVPHITLNYGEWDKEVPSGAFVCDWVNIHGFDKHVKINFNYES